jgi:phosphoribosylformimino-5-aminoimidazole carboxamide ribotide isomerase
MRVVGVIDLMGGMAVHAVRGERERYRPLGDPLRIARAYRSELGLAELYVADLDAIAGTGDHDSIIGALASEARLMVDAGAAAPERARALLGLGADRVVVGTETLPCPAAPTAPDASTGRGALSAPDALDRLLTDVPDVVLSVDLREGRLLSPDPQLAGLQALDALARLHHPGLREAIVLDLARVGSGEGPDVGLIAELGAAFGDLQLLAGGGVRDLADLRALRAAGAAGALVATALHRGVIGPRELAELR